MGQAFCGVSSYKPQSLPPESYNVVMETEHKDTDSVHKLKYYSYINITHINN